jgi:hypothetical protein
MKKWLKTYMRELTAETYTFVGLLIAYFTLEGSAKKVTGIVTLLGFTVWFITLPLRDKNE